MGMLVALWLQNAYIVLLILIETKHQKHLKTKKAVLSKCSECFKCFTAGLDWLRLETSAPLSVTPSHT